MMGRNCHKCQCPLTLLKGEKRRTCARCGGGRNKVVANREYREAHREKLIKADRDRYAADRKARLAKAKAYYEANKDEVLRKKKERMDRRMRKVASILHGGG